MLKFSLSIILFLLTLLSTNLLQAQIQKVDEEPYPEGGFEKFYKYISKHLKYPREARRQGISGKVITRFTVEVNGTLSNFEIAESVNTFLDNAALDVLKASNIKWIPGKINGKNVRTQMALPIVFKLDDYDEILEEKNLYVLQVSANSDSFFEASIGLFLLQKYKDGQFTGGLTLGTEYNFDNKGFAPKLGLSFQASMSSFLSLNFGFQHLWHIQNKNVDYVFRPEIGLGHKWAFVNYGYNSFVSGKSKGVTPHVVTLNLIIPIFSKKTY